MRFVVPDITPELIIQASEAVYFKQSECSTSFVSRFLDLSADYTSRALTGAEQLGFIKSRQQNNEVLFEPICPVCKYLVRSNKVEKPQVFRLQLEEFAPFCYFTQRLIVNVNPIQAIKEAKSLYELETNATVLKETLTNWGTFAGSLKLSDSGNLIVAPESNLQNPLEVFTKLQDTDAQVRTYICNKLGEKVFADLPSKTIEDLVTAYMKFKNDPQGRECVFFLGNIFEGFLKTFAQNNTPPIDLTGKTSIISIGDELRSRGAIAVKHLGYIHYIGHLRNAADHDIDTEIREEWQITSTTIEELNHVTWSAIKSILSFRLKRYVL